jgi:nicotinamidase/pyrazinamidase
MKEALIVVDVQNDFIPGGALAVPEGDLIVPVANQMMGRFDLVVATQDWHPPDHGSFASRYPGKRPGDFVELNGRQQILWPDHCVAHSSGAAFVSGLDVDGIAHVVRKGMDKRVDSYSGFFDNDHRKTTGLGEYLRNQAVDQVAIMGLATEYCVKFTALDARRLGFKTRLIREGVRGVELNPGDCEKAITAMRDAGVRIVGVEDI